VEAQDSKEDSSGQKRDSRETVAETGGKLRQEGSRDGKEAETGGKLRQEGAETGRKPRRERS